MYNRKHWFNIRKHLFFSEECCRFSSLYEEKIPTNNPSSVQQLCCVRLSRSWCEWLCVFYSLSLASLASMALVATRARSDSSAACSAGPCDWAFFSRKWLMKSFKPSRSIPSLGIPEILADGKQWGTLIWDVHMVWRSKDGWFYKMLADIAEMLQ